MTLPEWLGIVGSGCGALGSAVTAYSLGNLLWEITFACRCVENTVRALARNDRNIVIMDGLDERHKRAERRATAMTRGGVALTMPLQRFMPVRSKGITPTSRKPNHLLRLTFTPPTLTRHSKKSWRPLQRA
jgi:hypothetical protein